MRTYLSLLLIFLVISETSFGSTIDTPVSSKTLDGSGNSITSTSSALDVNIKTPATLPVSAASLPLPSGAATSAKQPALGTAGASSSDVISVQGISGGVAIPISGTFAAAFNTRSDTFTATANGTTVDAHLAPVKYFSLYVVQTGSITSWTVVLEASLDNVNFTTVLTHTNTTPGTGLVVFGGTSAFPALYFRARCSAITLGAGTNVVATILGM